MLTGKHVEVFREASQAGQRRRYSKRFLVTEAGDLRHWTEREGNILTRLAGLGVAPEPRLEPFDRGEEGRLELVRTYDAGVTVEHWATLLPVQRDGTPVRHVFEDCAHWWALARHCLMALDTLHESGVVHLDLKADNICIPAGPADADPADPGAVLTLRFEQLALIDFAFSLVPGESLSQPLPIAGETAYVYQSPRLLIALEAGRGGDLAPTRQLDWRCDLFSLAAMLRRYLPATETPPEFGWTPWRLALAHTLIRRLLEAHDAHEPAQRPHGALIALTKEALADAKLSASLRRGWALAAPGAVPPSDLATPLTRMAVPARPAAASTETEWLAQPSLAAPQMPPRRAAWAGWVAVAAIGAPLIGAAWWVRGPEPASDHRAEVVRAAPAEAASAAPMLPSPTAMPAQAMPPPGAPASAAAGAGEHAAQPLAAEPAPTPVATTTTTTTGTKAGTRRRLPTALPTEPDAAADRPWVNQAERERALEWLTRRGPSPRPGMTLPPAPAATRAQDDH